MRKEEITAAVVTGLLSRQFPQWADLPVSPVALDGWDNTTFRLGDTMSVRLPSGDDYVPQVVKEHRWLPVLGPLLPLTIPEPLAQGEPDDGFPRPWSVYRWIEGDTVSEATVRDRVRLAEDLAGFLTCLYRCDASSGPVAGAHSFNRGGPVAVWDDQVRGCLDYLGGAVDADGAADVWRAAVDAPGPDHAVWVHGDVTCTNLLARDDRLHAVIDFGCSAVGDPACDTTMAWTWFDGDSHEAFVTSLGLDDATWARGRGWALWTSLGALALERRHPDRPLPAAIRWGWRGPPAQVVEELIADHRRAG